MAAWYRPSRREGDHHRNTTVGHLDVLSQQQAFQVLERCRVWMNSLLGADPESSWHKNPRRYTMGMHARMYASWYAFMCADLPHTRKNKREREREIALMTPHVDLLSVATIPTCQPFCKVCQHVDPMRSAESQDSLGMSCRYQRTSCPHHCLSLASLKDPAVGKI